MIAKVSCTCIVVHNILIASTQKRSNANALTVVSYCMSTRHCCIALELHLSFIYACNYRSYTEQN